MTAEEFLLKNTGEKDISKGNIKPDSSIKLMIEFAKLHVEAQKQAVKKDLEEGLNETYGIYLTDDFKLEQTGNDLIDSAYPLTNIK
jgi:hypothetical protein